MISRSIRELTLFVDVEKANFRAATLVAIADHRDGVAGNEHLVVPGVTGIDVWTKGIDSGYWSQRAVADCDCEESTPTQDYQVIAVKLDNATFVDPGVLSIGD